MNTQNTAGNSFDESALVEVTMDRMEATITFVAPVNNGRSLTREEIVSMISNEGVVVDHTRLDEVLRNRVYERKVQIAKGRDPVPGIDGYLQFHFDRSSLKPKPKIMEDGSVNFKQLNKYRLCNRGDVLVTLVHPREGSPGLDVYGNSVAPPTPKEASAIPMGKGTIMSEDGLHLLADVSGQLLILDGKINISPQLDIEANVDNSTGNIEFNGQVYIAGNVTSGFVVKAAGNIEVAGVCEAATLISEKGNIVLGGGAQGGGKAELKAAQDITAKFIESCTVEAGGNITADSILKSTVKCAGTVILAGKNGLLVGGKLVAGKNLTAVTIGSPMGTSTEIEVGGNPEDTDRHSGMVDEYNRLRLEFEKCDKAVTMLQIAKQRGALDEAKKTMLIKMINTKTIYREKMTAIQNDIDIMARTLTVNTGTVAASNIIRPGVKITIGSAQLLVREDLAHCKLRNNGEKVAVGPYS